MEETHRPKAPVAMIAAAVLLALNLTATAALAARVWSPAPPARPARPRYEYRVAFAADAQVEAVVQGLGREGWHITSTRRARDGAAGDDAVGAWGYEFFAERELELPMQAVAP